MRVASLILAALLAAAHLHAAEAPPPPALLELVGTAQNQPDDLWMAIDSAALRIEYQRHPPAPRPPAAPANPIPSSPFPPPPGGAK